MNAVTLDSSDSAPRRLERRRLPVALRCPAYCLGVHAGQPFDPHRCRPSRDTGNGRPGHSISGLFAVLTSLFISSVSSRFDRRHVLISLTGLMMVSLVLIAESFNFTMLMIARAALGVAVGGFWALATATLMRLVPEHLVPKALAIVYTGNAVATAFAAPWAASLVASSAGVEFSGRLVPLVVVNVLWQWSSLPSLPSKAPTSSERCLSLKRPRSRSAWVVFRSLLPARLRPSPTSTSLSRVRHASERHAIVVAAARVGSCWFVGTYAVGHLLTRRLRSMLWMLPVALAVVTVGLLLAGRERCWRRISHDRVGRDQLRDSCRVVCVAGQGDSVINQRAAAGRWSRQLQLSIMLGAAFGGWWLDHWSIYATFIGRRHSAHSCRSDSEPRRSFC